MKGIFISCPTCRKPLFKNAYLRAGSFLTTKCFHCGDQISVKSEVGRLVILGLLPVDNLADKPLTDDDESDIMVVGL